MMVTEIMEVFLYVIGMYLVLGLIVSMLCVIAIISFGYIAGYLESELIKNKCGYETAKFYYDVHKRELDSKPKIRITEKIIIAYEMIVFWPITLIDTIDITYDSIESIKYSLNEMKKL